MLEMVCSECGYREAMPALGVCKPCLMRYHRKTRRARYGLPVIRDDGQEFPNCNEAFRQTYGGERDANGKVAQACRTGKSYRGVHWRWADE